MFLIFLNGGSYFLTEKLRSGVEYMGEGGVETVGRIKKKNNKNQYTNKNTLIGDYAFFCS